MSGCPLLSEGTYLTFLPSPNVKSDHPKGIEKIWGLVHLLSSVQSLTLCDPMDCSMPGFPVHHQLPEFAQTHVH